MSTPPLPSDDHPKPNGGDLSGRRLGDFQLLRRLGRGAMAEVYLAEQDRLKRRVAVKILKPELAGDRTYLQRFELEAQAAASLVHANIVQIYEVGCVDKLHYIAQEYVQGQNLRDYLARHGPPDLSHALSIMRQVASALAKAAEQGVVHRDIKPENIMLTAGGEVKVADFGLARLTREGTANDLTQVGITLGTPLYMSPEQVEGKALDPRSDLYSLGVTCYQMLSGSPPFTGETALGVAVQHLKSRPQPLEAIRPDLPASLCRIVHRMLAKLPAERFASATRFAARAASRSGGTFRRRLARRPSELGIAGGGDARRSASGGYPASRRADEINRSAAVALASLELAYGGRPPRVRHRRRGGVAADRADPVTGGRRASSSPKSTRSKASNDNVTERHRSAPRPLGEACWITTPKRPITLTAPNNNSR